MLTESLISLKASVLIFAGLISIGYLAYLRIILTFILKQALLCVIASGVSKYQCIKRTKKNINRYSFLKHKPYIKFKNHKHKITGIIKIKTPTLIIKNEITYK